MHSLSKSSNLAGYRAGFVTGDPELVAGLLAVRKHAGMIVARPVQQAMVAALSDDTHVAQQRDRYARRRELLRPALGRAGLPGATVAGWALPLVHRGRAVLGHGHQAGRLGVLVAPGDFYGPAGVRHVRVALTATDERIAAAVHRLTMLPAAHTG